MESSLVCNHRSGNKIGEMHHRSPICLSWIWLQTKLEDTKSYYNFQETEAQ